MANKKVDAFAMYAKKETYTAAIKALGGAEIEYRKPTMSENDKFRKMMVSGVDDHGRPIMDADKFYDVKYAKVSAMLVNPKKTVAELQALSGDASEAINEIIALAGDEDEAEGNV